MKKRAVFLAVVTAAAVSVRAGGLERPAGAPVRHLAAPLYCVTVVPVYPVTTAETKACTPV